MFGAAIRQSGRRRAICFNTALIVCLIIMKNISSGESLEIWSAFGMNNFTSAKRWGFGIGYRSLRCIILEHARIYHHCYAIYFPIETVLFHHLFERRIGVV